MTPTQEPTSSVGVTCATYREALSAELDNEPAPVDAALHVARCDGCAEWARELPVTVRRLRVSEADDIPDLTERILTAIMATVPRPSLALTLGRAALMAVALAQTVFGAIVLLSGDQHPHISAESGAWNIAIGIAFATAAMRPAAAYAVLPMVASLVAVLAFASARDLVTGSVSPGRVLSHALIVLGLVLVAVVTWRMRDSRHHVSASPHSQEGDPLSRAELMPQ